MSNIELYQQPNALAEIPSRDNEIANALKSRLISTLSDEEAFELLKANITKAYVSARYEMPLANELIIIADETMKAFKMKFGSLRENEIAILFTRGLCGDYGDFKGLSLITFVNWVLGYLKELSRIKLTTHVEEKKEPSLSERFEIAKSLALKTFDDFIQEKSIELQGATVYRFLAKLGIIKYSDQEQEEFMTGAHNEVIAKKHREKITSMDKHIRSKIERELEQPQLLEEKIKFTAQHNGLVKYFDALKFVPTPKAYLLNQINEHAKTFLK